MQRIAKFGYVWKHRKTGAIHGTKIDIKDFDELNEYEQISKEKAETPKENEGETLFVPSKSRRSQ